VKQNTFLGVAAALGLITAAPAAKAYPLAAQVGLGTEGVGVTVTAPVINNTLNINFGFSRFNNGFNFSANQARFKANATLGAIPVTLSYYPFSGSFNADAGILFNQNQVSVSAIPMAGAFIIDGHVGSSLTGKTGFNAMAPYIGIGLGNPVVAGSPWSLNANIGMMYEGTPDVRLNAGGAADNPQMTADVKKIQNQVNRELDFLSFWPVASVSVSYRFF
jgi:hypothetical protein